MSKKMPAMVELAPGTYYWCSCGRSKNEPFCDGSHGETSAQPRKFVVTTKRVLALCNCQRTRNAPLCDDTHKKPSTR